MTSRLETTLSHVSGVQVLRSVPFYPDVVEVRRLLESQAPTLVFCETQDVHRFCEIARLVDSGYEGGALIGFGRQFDQEVLLQSMRLGVREILRLPFAVPDVEGAIERIEALVVRSPQRAGEAQRLISFLPAKAGVGATTIAVNAASAMSKAAPGRVLLTDFDLHFGIVRFMLGIRGEHSVLEAIENGHQMDESLWRQLVTRIDDLDVLHAGRLDPHAPVDTGALREIIGFVRRTYPIVCCDLSGGLEPHAIEILNCSTRILLVCTPEIPALHLARQRYAQLKRLELESRVSLVVNRFGNRNGISAPQLEEVLGVPVMTSLPNDYDCVHHSVATGRPVDAGTELGKQYARLAAQLMDRSIPASSPEPLHRRILASLTAAAKRAPLAPVKPKGSATLEPVLNESARGLGTRLGTLVADRLDSESKSA